MSSTFILPMKTFFGFPILFLVTTVPVVAQTTHEINTILNERIETFAQNTLREAGLPSIQVAVGHQGAVIFEGAYGLANIEHDVLATTQTKYRTASISKWLTGTAAMRLYENGVLDLDLPAQTYCPAFPEKPWPITTRQLLSHTSGIRHYLNYDALLAETDAETARNEVIRQQTRDLIGTYTRYTDVVTSLNNFKEDPLEFEPGTQFRYSSYGYRVLACVIEGAAGKSYSDVLLEQVLDPADMNSTLNDDSRAIIMHRATGYELQNDGTLLQAPFRDVSENLAAGGHLSTATDLTRFAQAFAAGLLVSDSTIVFMALQPTDSSGQQIDSGYGHGVDLIGWLPGSLGHNGRQEGTTTILVLLPEEDLSIAVMSNASGWPRINVFAGTVLGIVGDLLGIHIALPSD